MFKRYRVEKTNDVIIDSFDSYDEAAAYLTTLGYRFKELRNRVLERWSKTLENGRHDLWICNN